MQIVQVEVHVVGAPDGYGGFEDSWLAPEERVAFGWAPAGSSEPKTVGANRQTVDVELFAPWTLAAKDRVTINGEVFEVAGHPEDWNHGPFGFEPGHVVNLVQVRG